MLIRRFFLVALCAATLAACGKVFEDRTLPRSFELPAGQQIDVEFKAPASLAELTVGDAFAGILAEPLYYVREAVDDGGRTFKKATLIAPEGAPVHGIAVAPGEAAEGAAVGLRLESVTFHGGKSFPIDTAIWIPSTQPDEAGGDKSQASTEVLAFQLAEPADVALVIDFRLSGENEM